jgi:L-ascorbate metabolism protein UlaG (beta-lactamase superfamily)
MQIKYLRHSSFKIKGKTYSGKEVTIITDPFNPESVGKFKYPKQDANIVTLSHTTHKDHNAIENINGESPKDYILLDTPGEYEIKDLIVNGIKSYHDDKQGAERGKNTIFVYDFEEARVMHLGDLGHKLTNEQLDELEEDIDILIIPVGGHYTIDAKTAVDVIEQIEPAIVIPMHYKTDAHSAEYNELTTVDEFISKMGTTPERVSDFTLKAHKDLPGELTILVFEK